MEDMDVTDRNFRPCKCGYQICLFCYRHIKDDLNGLCPACRTPYDEANVSFVTPDPQECEQCPARGRRRKGGQGAQKGLDVPGGLQAGLVAQPAQPAGRLQGQLTAIEAAATRANAVLAAR